jgi:hypothetical protein
VAEQPRAPEEEASTVSNRAAPHAEGTDTANGHRGGEPNGEAVASQDAAGNEEAGEGDDAESSDGEDDSSSEADDEQEEQAAADGRCD